MQRKDLPKQKRRKRKDPESRDFKCICGKSYLSYAAVYTHVKNKHDGDKGIQDSIAKPVKEKLKRGRPKDKKQIVISSETQTLSICEQTTLQIYEQLKDKKDNFSHNIILQGNQEMNEFNFDEQYRSLSDNKPVRLNLLTGGRKVINESQDNDQQQEEQDSGIFEKFIKGVIKHFSAQIAARVAYVVNSLAQLYEQLNFQDGNQTQAHMKQLNQLQLWHGQNEINHLIYQAMVKWIITLRKQQDNE